MRPERITGFCSSGCRSPVGARSLSAADLDVLVGAFECRVVSHLRYTQFYVHCAREGASVFDLPRSRGEHDWVQWMPLTRWITRQAPD